MLGGLAGLCAESLWKRLKDQLVAETENLTMGNVTDLSNFMGAVIDDRAFAKHKKAIARAKRSQKLDVIAGGQVDDSIGYFVRPTIVEATDPTDEIFSEEYFGPILAVHVYDDAPVRGSRGPDGVVRAVRPDRRGVRPGPRGGRVGDASGCASRPATSTSTTSPPARSWGSSRSAARAPRAPTTRPAPGQPDALDLGAVDQGDVRPAEGLPLPAHGLTCASSDPLHLGPLHPVEQVLTLVLAFGPFVLLALTIWISRRRNSRDSDPPGP